MGKEEGKRRYGRGGKAFRHAVVVLLSWERMIFEMDFPNGR